MSGGLKRAGKQAGEGATTYRYVFSDRIVLQLRERHIIAATKLGFSFTDGFFVLGVENVVRNSQPLWFDHHGSVDALKLDKIAFPQGEVLAEPCCRGEIVPADNRA